MVWGGSGPPGPRAAITSMAGMNWISDFWGPAPPIIFRVSVGGWGQPGGGLIEMGQSKDVRENALAQLNRAQVKLR